MCTFCHEHSEPVHTMFSLGTLLLPGPRWYRKGSRSKLLLASPRSDGARRRKTAGNIADGLRCCIWRRAEKPDKMTHHLTGGGKHSNGYIALLHPDALASRQPQYLAEHRLLSFLGKKICHFIHDFHPHWIARLGLPYCFILCTYCYMGIKVCTHCNKCAHLQNMCTSVTLCAHLVHFVQNV